MAEKNFSESIICVIGLGYVGLPLAEAFSKHFKVIGFDIDSQKVGSLNKAKTSGSISFTDSAVDISQADFIIICVPTPLTKENNPNLKAIQGAAATAGKYMKKGAAVVLESTVYPGVTEEVVKPLLEKESGMRCGVDFKIGYSPERINPGDDEHTISKVTKVVAGCDEETTERLAALYAAVAKDVFKAKDIKTAEASKVIENVQRDVNIGLVNEFALIFEKLGLNTQDVLNAAGTKWNFHRYSPGIVGGHCIPVVPHYLMHKAREAGYEPQIIKAGRQVNDGMPRHIASITAKALEKAGKTVSGANILIMGLTYKEDVPDTQDSHSEYLAEELRKLNANVIGFDPILKKAADPFGVKTYNNVDDIPKVDAAIICVAHKAFCQMKLEDVGKLCSGKPVIIDIKQIFSQSDADALKIIYRTL